MLSPRAPRPLTSALWWPFEWEDSAGRETGCEVKRKREKERGQERVVKWFEFGETTTFLIIFGLLDICYVLEICARQTDQGLN